MTTESPRWFKSSYSSNGGQCVEVATNLVSSQGVVPVRDSKAPQHPALSLPIASFSAFIAALKNDAF
ncbi:hypothetical protein HEK616_01460 [Streptomyces nigrescens]|uniref:DUF397 domain-containing protein n=3 Tax=Streptomyces TaxID=1883 RepID=A0ABY6PAY7_9ACTN|nr:MULTISPECIES: DUF397 domain-containing protein [Streptomyces]MEE4423107.1 DUF397 domain-containing protein [Streptomyces sp. DSM 41528]UZJ30974.1 DUF397 domain-containing protein [Streptomyces endophytica]BDM66659.1 hypothetical protein HEK616_01460 [Streptomyces nigrescens]